MTHLHLQSVFVLLQRKKKKQWNVTEWESNQLLSSLKFKTQWQSRYQIREPQLQTKQILLSYIDHIKYGLLRLLTQTLIAGALMKSSRKEVRA